MRVTIDEMLGAARLRLNRLTPQAAHDAVRNGNATLVDIRTSDGRARDGRIPRALIISLNVLEWRLDPGSPSRHPSAPDDLDAWIVLVCEQGYSSSLAAIRLQDLGFRRATDVVGGFEAWAAAGLPVTAIRRPSPRRR